MPEVSPLSERKMFLLCGQVTDFNCLALYILGIYMNLPCTSQVLYAEFVITLTPLTDELNFHEGMQIIQRIDGDIMKIVLST